MQSRSAGITHLRTPINTTADPTYTMAELQHNMPTVQCPHAPTIKTRTLDSRWNAIIIAHQELDDSRPTLEVVQSPPKRSQCTVTSRQPNYNSRQSLMRLLSNLDTDQHCCKQVDNFAAHYEPLSPRICGY